MTRAIAVMLIAAVAVIALPRPTAYAGDKEWATAGKILAGVVGTSDDNNRRVVVQRRYTGTRVRRVRYVRSPKRTWVPGHYEIRAERIWIEGYWEEVWIPPEYKRIRVTRYDRHGRAYTAWEKVLVREGHHEKIWHEGYWETREVREWIAGHWEYR